MNDRSRLVRLLNDAMRATHAIQSAAYGLPRITVFDPPSKPRKRVTRKAVPEKPAQLELRL